MNKKQILLASLLLLALGSVALAADVLDIGSGAKSISMGRTYTSVKADGYGVFGNPAALTGLCTGEIVSMAGSMSDDVKYTLLGYVYPTQYGNFSIGYANNSVSGFTSTTLDAVSGRPAALADFDLNNDLFLLGYQNDLTALNTFFSYGLRLKYFSKGLTIVGATATGINADAGVTLVPNERLTLGMVGKNIIPGGAGALKLSNGQSEDLPGALDLGLGYKVFPKLDLFADASFNKLIPMELKLGTQWQICDQLALRAGAEQKSLGLGSSYINGSAGLGINLGILGIDYAYYYDSFDTNNSRHFISFTVQTDSVKRPESASAPILKPQTSIQTAAAPAPAVTMAAPQALTYTVKERDSLWRIAKENLGDPLLYQDLARENNIKNPDLIYPNQTLILKKNP